jgi:hypothetical protein
MNTEIIHSKSLGRFERYCGLFCFLFINPLFIYIWFDNPKFVSGEINFPEIFMGIVTILMVSLGCWGFLAFFQKTYLYPDRIVTKGLFKDKILNLKDIDRIHKTFVFWDTSFIQLILKEGNKIEFSSASEELSRKLEELIEKYNKISSTDG